MTYFESTYVILLSLCFGSFANVCIYRLPVDKSMLSPSICMHCQKPIPFYFNIPVIAYIFLRGKTSCCQKPLAIQYPIVEALSAFGGIYIAYINGLNIDSILSFFFFLSIIIIFLLI